MTYSHKITFSYQRSKYHQTVESRPYDFISAGDTNISTVSWDYVLHRSSSMKTNYILAACWGAMYVLTAIWS